MTDTSIVLGARDVGRLLTFRECIDAIARTMCAHEAGSLAGCRPVDASAQFVGEIQHQREVAARLT